MYCLDSLRHRFYSFSFFPASDPEAQQNNNTKYSEESSAIRSKNWATINLVSKENPPRNHLSTVVITCCCYQ